MSIYHYTNTEALLSILKSGSLRMTDFRFLNDSSELSQLGTTLTSTSSDHPLSAETRDRINDREKNGARVFSDQDQYRNEYLSQLACCMENVGFLGVLCFTQHANNLSHWLSYCPKGLGVAVEFDRELIEGFAVADGHTVLNCVYDGKDIHTEAKKWIDSIDLANGTEFPDITARDDFSRVVKMAATYKHPAFSNENEVRIVSEPMFLPRWPRTYYHGPETELPLQFRTGFHSAVPFIDFNICRAARGEEPVERSLCAIKSITIGPTREPHLAMHAIRMALRATGLLFDPAVIRYCDLPFRQN
jgi:hypothetical protein